MSLVQKTEAMVRRLWEQSDAGILREMFTPDARIHGLEETGLIGPEEFAAFHRMVVRQFSDISIDDVTGVEQDPWTALAFRIHATEIESGRKVTCMAFLMARFDGDRVSEGLNFLDFMALFEQSGRLPPRTRDMCLLGNRLRLSSDTKRRAH